ncbi:MAG: hypothetical protein KDH09_15360 [Chrysiogenetes bacterium]|nr:hypothetical protein [Chrysiogenetes bacterium]
MKRFYLTCTLLLLSGIAHAAGGPLGSNSAPDFLPVDEAFELTATRKDGMVELRWFALPGYYLYRHSLSFEGEGVEAGAAEIPPGLKKHDEYFGDVEVYYGELLVDLPLRGQPQEVRVRVRYQGCADAGLCYPPQKRTLKIPLEG